MAYHACLLCCCSLQAAAPKMPTVEPPANRDLHTKPTTAAGEASALPARRATRLAAAPSQATAVLQQAPAAKAQAKPGSAHKARGLAQAAAPKPVAAAAASRQAAAAPLASFSRKRQLHAEEDSADASYGVQRQQQPSKQARQAPAAGKAEMLFDSLFQGGEEEEVPQQQVLPATQQPVWAASQSAWGSRPEAGWGGRADNSGSGGGGDSDLAAAVQKRMELHKAKMAQSRRRGSLSRRQLEQEQ